MTAMTCLVLAANIAGTPYGNDEKPVIEQPFVWEENERFENWDRAIRRFRGDHNFSLLVGRNASDWIGKISGHADRLGFSTQGSEILVAYSFHIPWAAGFGYTLGTSGGLILAEGSTSYKVNYTSMLPGVELGLVWNISSRFRLMATGLYAWQRINGLRLAERWDHRKISLTGETFGYRFALDYFYKLTWALRFEYEQVDFYYLRSKSLELEKTSYHSRLGIVKHLL